MDHYSHFDDYQAAACKTAVYPRSYKGTYPLLGLCNEVGELAGKCKKILRGDREGEGLTKWRVLTEITPEEKEAITCEMGDVLWYLAVMASDMGIDLSDVALENIRKLRDRAARGVLKGDGDKR